MTQPRQPVERTEKGAWIHSKIGDISVCLRSDTARVREDFIGYYPEYQCTTQPPDSAIQMEIRKAGRSRLGRPLYQVYGDGQEIGGPRAMAELFPFLEWGINLRVIERQAKYLQLHAASLVRFGNGCVFAGQSGCGKSTLAAGLLARGWGYLCDEFALIDPQSLRIQPFPKALCIKAGSFESLDRFGLPLTQRRHHIKGIKGRVGYINPADVGPNARADAAPIRFIIFPKYAENAEPKLRPVSPGRALLDLACCIFNRHTFGGDALAVLAEVVRGAECYQLEAGDLEKSCRLLESELHLSAQSVTSKAVEPKASLSTSRRKIGGSPVPLLTRREALRLGTRLAYIVPTVVTFSAQEALAGTSIPSGLCSTAVQSGGLCETDADCCTSSCDLGVCK